MCECSCMWKCIICVNSKKEEKMVNSWKDKENIKWQSTHMAVWTMNGARFDKWESTKRYYSLASFSEWLNTALVSLLWDKSSRLCWALRACFQSDVIDPNFTSVHAVIAKIAVVESSMSSWLNVCAFSWVGSTLLGPWLSWRPAAGPLYPFLYCQRKLCPVLKDNAISSDCKTLMQIWMALRKRV